MTIVLEPFLDMFSIFVAAIVCLPLSSLVLILKFSYETVFPPVDSDALVKVTVLIVLVMV